MNNKKILMSALIPIIVLGSWSLYLSLIYLRGEVVELSVKARDPRDLLAGQYLTYAVDYGHSICSANENKTKSFCICFDNNRPAKSSWSGDCESMPQDSQCAKYLKGSCNWITPETGIEKYYIPEEYSRFLKRVPENSTILVNLDGFGNGIVTDFLVERKPLSEYIKTRQLP